MPSRTRSRLGARLLAGITAVCWLVVPSVALAATSSEGTGTTTGGEGSASEETGQTPSDDEQVAVTSTPAIEVSVTPLVADGRDDGDLVLVDEEAGFVALLFSPTAPAEQRAVHEVRVRNAGDTPLAEVAVTDDQMGTILAASDGTTLAPGEEVVAEAEMTFTFDEVTTDRGGLVFTTTTATATAEDSTVVSDTAETRVELVAVLADPGLDAPTEDAATDTEVDAAQDTDEEADGDVSRQLPNAGLDAGTALPLAIASLGAGGLLLAVSRPRTAGGARLRRRRAAVWHPWD